MPFYFSKASSTGLRLASSDTMIQPAPTYVNYPVEALGTILETQDGITIQQQQNQDGRVREWVWVGYRESIPGYVNLWNNLLSLRARHLKEAGAQTPYVYLKETDTHRLRRRVTYNGLATSAAAGSISDSAAPFEGSNALAQYIVYIIDGQGAGQSRRIVTNSTTQLDVSPNWDLTPNTTSRYSVVGWVDDWMRVRVLDVSRELDSQPTNPPGFAKTTIKFVIQDQTYNDLG